MNVDKVNFHVMLKPIVFFSLIAYVLAFCLEQPNYFIRLDMFKITLLGLLVFALFYNTKRVKIKFDWWIYLCLFGVIALLSTHTSNNYLVSSIKISLDALMVTFGFLLYVIFFDELNIYAKPLLLTIVLVFVVYAGPITISEIYFQVSTKEAEYWNSGFALTSSFKLSYYNHIRHFSYHAFICSCLSYILVVYSNQNQWQKYFFALFFAFCFFSLLLSYGRGAIFSLFIFVVLDSFFNRGFASAIKVSLLFIISVVLIYTVLYFTSLGVVSEFIYNSFFRGNSENIQDNVNALSSGRLSMWEYAIKKTHELNPIYGNGSASASWLFKGTPHQYAGQPHNLIIQFIMDYGYLGAFVLISVMIKFFKCFFVFFYIGTPNENFRRSLLCFIVSYIMFSFVDGLFFHSYPMINFIIVVAILASVHSSMVESKN